MNRQWMQLNSIDDADIEYDGSNTPDLVSEGQGNLVSSRTDDPNWHMPVLDIDLPCRLVPSTTEGHFHLYIDHPVFEGDYFKLLDALADCGILEHGYVNASVDRGFTCVRAPGVRKGDSLREVPANAVGGI